MLVLLGGVSQNNIQSFNKDVSKNCHVLRIGDTKKNLCIPRGYTIAGRVATGHTETLIVGLRKYYKITTALRSWRERDMKLQVDATG